MSRLSPKQFVAVAVGSFLLIALAAGVFVHVAFSGLDYDPRDDELTGKAARQRIPSQLPDSASGFWVFDGGSFNGSIFYASFRCDSVEDCWKALESLGAPDQTAFRPGVGSSFAVCARGPNFYWPQLDFPQWNLTDVARGVSYERRRDDRDLWFWAIDMDRKVVYFHRESGGFPAEPSPSTRSSGP